MNGKIISVVVFDDEKSSGPKLGSFQPQALANTAWAFASVGHLSPELFDAISETATPKLRSFNPQALANTAWAFATVGHSSPELFDAISETAIPKLRSFNPQGVANKAWAFATVGHSSPELFDALSETAMPKLGSFNPQALANMAWAFAVLNSALTLISQIFNEICKQYQQDQSMFSREELCQLHQALLWSAAERDANLSISKHLKEKCYEAFTTLSSQLCTSRLQTNTAETFRSLDYDV